MWKPRDGITSSKQLTSSAHPQVRRWPFLTLPSHGVRPLCPSPSMCDAGAAWESRLHRSAMVMQREIHGSSAAEGMNVERGLTSRGRNPYLPYWQRLLMKLISRKANGEAHGLASYERGCCVRVCCILLCRAVYRI
jgi:hypothetical protein